MLAPIATVAMGGQKLGGLGTGTLGTDAVNKSQMDAAVAGVTSGVGVSIGAGTSDGSGNVSITGLSFVPGAFLISYFDASNNPQTYLFNSGTVWGGATGMLVSNGFTLTGIRASTTFSYIAFRNS